jgi:signal transduction histidine kinase
VDLLKDLTIEFQNETGIETTLVISPNPAPLSSPIAEVIYRILREALTNTRKHAHASAILVSLLCDNRKASITVQDNGSGLAQDQLADPETNKLHFGLSTMREMIVSLGGELYIGNNDEHGLMIKASIPLPGSN